jgi:predicted permease
MGICARAEIGDTMAGFARDLRHAARALVRAPSFTTVVVLTLALGIGATTALFTLMDALLWRPLPVREPSDLAYIARLDHLDRRLGLGSPLVELLKNEQMFEGLCAFQTPYVTVTLGGRMAPMATHAMTGDCFETLGVRAALGRLFTMSDDNPASLKVAVLSHQAWLRDYGGRPDVLGELVDVAGESFTIVGVAERRFSGLVLGFPPHVLYPISHQPRSPGDARPAGTYSGNVFARLTSGRSLETTRTRLQERWPGLLAASPPARLSGDELDRYVTSRLYVASAETGIDYVLRERFAKPITALVSLAAIVLLVAVVNVAGLLLARADERHSERAVRLALGAGRSRLIREAAAESLLLITAGAGIGVATAYWGNRVLVSMLGLIYGDFALDVTPDARVLWLTLVISAIAVAVFALVPTWRLRDIDVATFATASSRVIGGPRRAHGAFVATQVALALVLLVVGGFTAQVLGELKRAPLGFEGDNVWTAQLMALPGGYGAGLSDPVHHETLLENLAAAPGIEAVALSTTAPLFSGSYTEPVSSSDSPDVQVVAAQHTVSEGFFSTMRIPIVAGRSFSRADRGESPRSVIVSESVARHLFGTSGALGRRVRIGTRSNLQSLEVVGVARDAVLTEPQARSTMRVYRSFWEVEPVARASPVLVVKARGVPSTIERTVREELSRGGRQYPAWFRSLAEQRETALAQERLVSGLSAAFATVGVTLMAAGIYGLLRLFVARRTREIAMRVALGASPMKVRRLVLAQVSGFMAAGIAIGLPIAWTARSAVSRVLGSDNALSLMPVVIAFGVLMLAGLVAAWLPARAATSIDPARALRGD